MRPAAIEVDIVSFSSLLGSCAGSSRPWGKVVHLLAEISHAVAVPNAVTYVAAIGACASAWQWPDALALIVREKDEGAFVYSASYGTAAEACVEERARSSDTSAALVVSLGLLE